MKFVMPPDWGHKILDDGTRELITPRSWQSTAMPIMLRHYAGNPHARALVRAVMGSGKSILMSQFVAACVLEPDEVIVVSTTTRKLVQQLAATFRDRLDPEFMSGESRVGCYYTDAKDTQNPIIITCTPSVPEIARILQSRGKKCALWMGDECHKTEVDTIKAAHEILIPEQSIGFTATPYRAKEEESLTLFEKVPGTKDGLLVNYGPKEALRDGVIVPFRTISWTGGEAPLDDACIEMTALARGPGMYNAMNIADAELFTIKLKDAGINADTVHSKLKDSEITARIAALRTGRLSALVHVSMLQEGVDFPWLRWLCMRRPVGSRVRYAQEIGRALRAYVDPITGDVKKEAVIYDPHGLCEELKLTYDAVLGGEYEVEAQSEEDPEKRRAREMEQMVFEVMQHLVQVKAGKAPLSVTPLNAYLRELTMAFDICGLIDRKILPRAWRHNSASTKQINALNNMRHWLNNKKVPRLHGRALNMIIDQTRNLSRGMASDLMSITSALADYKVWPDFKNLDQAAADAMKRNAEKRPLNYGQRPAQQPGHVGTMQPPRKAMTPAELKAAQKAQEKNKPTLFDQA